MENPIAEMATPVKSIMTTLVLPPLVEILYTKSIARSEPINAAMPTNENCTASGRNSLKCLPKTMVMAAINVAPEVRPIKSPVARGFLNNPCKLVPETESMLPIKIAITILEALTSQTMYLSLTETPESSRINFPKTSNAERPPKS